MSNFWEIKKRDYYWTAIELKKYLPQLDGVETDRIVDHLRGSGLGIVSQRSKPKPFYIRLTLPFGLIFILLLVITLPIKFMITGTWNYEKQWMSNWFKALGF
jgi:hypothetical protein